MTEAEAGGATGPAPEILAALRDLGLEPRLAVSAARLGFWRIGGPVDCFVEVQSLAQLQGVLGLGEAVSVLGNGSNLLVSDAGIRGLSLRVGGALKDSVLDARSGVVEAGAGLLNVVLLKRLERAGRAPLGALAGVPGTVGGAVRMNAGTSLGWIGDVVESVGVVLPGGELRRLEAGALGFRYRWAELPEGAVIARVRLRTEADPDGTIAAEVARLMERRKATQPLDRPSCGSVFKNPEGDHAGRLIEAVGLKGAVEGNAQISPLHANFIVNNGGATAAEVYALVRRARDSVWAEAGVLLEPEVHPAGDWPEGAWPLPLPPGHPDALG